MTPSIIFCLSYDLSKELFIAFKVDHISTKKFIVVTDVVMTLLVPAESVLKYTCGHNIIYDMTLSTEVATH